MKNEMAWTTQKGFQNGFTLIELMIVVVIIGILAAFGLIMYQDYVVRTRLGEGLMLASTAKSLVAENAVNGINPLDSRWQGFVSTRNTSNISIDGPTGVITITGSAHAQNIQLLLTPTGNNGPLVAGVIPYGRVSWTCTEATGSVSQNRLPSDCR